MSQAARYFDGLTAAARAVSARLEGGMLVLRGEEGATAACWPVAEVERCDGGYAEAATLRRRGGAERLQLDDAGLLEALRTQGAPIGRRTRWDARHWGGMVLGLVASLAAAAWLLDRLPAMLAPLVPHRLERAWSSNAQAVLTGVASPCAGQAGMEALRGLVGKLAEAAGVSPAPLVVVLDNDLVNAFTLPDGEIVVMRGLIDAAQDGEELAGVLAHEMGHVQHRDATREMLRRIGLNITARSLGWGGDLAGTLTGLSYGRQAEARADDAALVTLSRAGLRADGLGRFMAVLEARGGDAGMPAFLSDHPGTGFRAERLRRPAVGAVAFDGAAWRSVRGVCGFR